VAYQRGQLKQIIRQRCDLENTDFETDIELNNLINDSASVLHDLLIACAGSNYATETASLTTTASVSSYALNTANFYTPTRISIVFDEIDYPLTRFEPEGTVFRTSASSWGPGDLPRYTIKRGSDSVWTIKFDPAPDKVTSVNLTYHTTAPVYTDDQDVISIPYPDYLVVEACIRIKDKEDRDTIRLERERASIQKRIEDWGATFDRANPFQTLDVTGFGRWNRRNTRMF
jgi:hypothetical protein